MREYYQQRLYWIFHYTSKKFGYCLAKTLCLIVGVPIYAVMFAVEMVLTAINMLFCWIPIVNVVVMVVCKSLMYLVGSTFYICILPDLKAFREATKEEVEYEVADAESATVEDADETATDE